MKNGKYILILAPDKYPGKRYRQKYCYEHHYVYWKNTGYIPDRKEIIHHKDGNYHNNNFSNLELMSKMDHVKLHSLEIKKDPTNMCKCFECGKSFHRRKPHPIHIYCSRYCFGKGASKLLLGTYNGKPTKIILNNKLQCCSCKQNKIVSEFGKDKHAPLGLRSRCKECYNKYMKNLRCG
jgi:hypothetical protein